MGFIHTKNICNEHSPNGIVPLKIFFILAILTLCEINLPLKFPASVILGVESTIFGLKNDMKKITP